MDDGVAAGITAAVPDEMPVGRCTNTGTDRVLDETPVVHEVLDGDAVLHHDDVADDPPVTAPPHRLRAQDRRTARARRPDELGRSRAELLTAGPAGVGAKGRDLPPGVGRGGVLLLGERASPAQTRVVAVADGELGREVLDRPAGRRGVAPAARETPDVHDRVHPASGEKHREVFASEPAVAEGEHRAGAQGRVAFVAHAPDFTHEPSCKIGRVRSLPSASARPSVIPPGGTLDAAGWAMLTIGAVGVVAGGLVAAVSAPLDLAHGSWLAAYLVLVGGVGQCAMGAARLLAPPPLDATSLGWVQVAGWNIGNALVITGTLITLPLVVDVGGLACVVALTIALLQSRRLRGTWAGWAYRVGLVVLLVSVPVGLVLAHLRAAS